jgi:hypothetical protein
MEKLMLELKINFDEKINIIGYFYLFIYFLLNIYLWFDSVFNWETLISD